MRNLSQVTTTCSGYAMSIGRLLTQSWRMARLSRVFSGAAAARATQRAVKTAMTRMLKLDMVGSRNEYGKVINSNW